MLAANSGNFSEEYGVREGDRVTIAMKEAGAYLDILSAVQLDEYSNLISDYSDLSNEQFASISATSMQMRLLQRLAYARC